MDNSSVKTIDRLVTILDYFSNEHSSVSLAELSNQLHLPKSTLHRFLSGLEAHGILRRDDDSRRWQLGYHLISWGSAAADSANLREVAAPVIQELSEKSGETSILTIYHNHQVICLDMCETNHPVRLRIQVGLQRHAHAGASSKALIAFLPDEELEAIVRTAGLPRLAVNTITDYDVLQAELARIRDLGYAESLEETDPGAWGVATPIRDWRGEVVAAVGLAGPTLRYSRELVEEYARLCRQASDVITACLSVGVSSKQKSRTHK